MSPRALAARLRSAGFPVLSFSNPDEDVDGAVVISPLVHVQVPFAPGCPNVGREIPAENENNTEFEFYPPRRSFDLLLSDLRAALAAARGAA